MPRTGLVLAWSSTAVILAGFFLPWVRIETAGGTPISGLLHNVGRVTITVRRDGQTVTSELSALQELPNRLSGAQIPQLVHHPNARAAMLLLELLTNTPSHWKLKSYGVYLVPGIALLGAILLTAFGGRPAFSVSLAVLCLGVAGGGGWKILTAKLPTQPIAVTIGPGLWISLGAYVALAIAAGFCSLSARRLH